MDGKEADQQTLSVRIDPRTQPDPHDLQANLDLWRQMSAAQGRARQSFAQSHRLGRQIEALKSDLPSVTAALTAARGWNTAARALRELCAQLGEIETDLEDSDRAPTDTQVMTAQKLTRDLDAAVSAWSAHVRDDLPVLNATLARAKLPKLTLPAAADLDLPLEDHGEFLP